ncbi:MAG: molybdopterin-dependent oxidoreductase, partial [Dokdonella sp.]
ALGSNLWLHTRRGEVLRTVPRDNESINECWLSDRDRYSHQGLYATDRATRPQVKRGDSWFEVEWEEALRAASSGLRGGAPGQLGALVHGSTSNEEGHLLVQLVHGLGSRSIDHRVRELDLSDAPHARAFEMPYAEIDKAAVIVLVGCDPRRELPLLNARLRTASRRGAQIHAINVLDIDLTYALAGKRVVSPSALLHTLSMLAAAADDGAMAKHAETAGGSLSQVDGEDYSRILMMTLKAAGSAVFVIGDGVSTHPQAADLRRAVYAIARSSGSVCNELPLGANAVGLSRVGVLPQGDGLDAHAQLARKGGGQILYGIESPLDLAGGAAAWKALAQHDHVVAFSAFASDALKQVADVILPIGLLPEIDATLVNLDGTEQRLAGGAKLPGDARPGWRVLRALGAALAIDGFDFTSIEDVRATIPRSVPLPSTERAVAPRDPAPAVAEGTFVRIDTTAIYRGDAVLRRSPALNAHPLTRGARIGLHPHDALALGIDDGDSARVADKVLAVDVTREVPIGAVWIESGYEETNGLPAYGAVLSVARA